MLFEQYNDFIDIIYTRLKDLGIDTDPLVIDHIGYQADSAKDFDEKILEISNSADKISENIVGGRRVAVFSLNYDLEYLNQKFNLFEIFEPREGQTVKSDWEHVEFVSDFTLEELISKYPNLEWDKSALDRDEFPMLILKLGDGLRAKFPRRGVLEEAKRAN